MEMQENVQRTYKETIVHYEELRQAVYEFVEEEYSVYDVSLSEISHSDALDADSWSSLWNNSNRIAYWSWAKLYSEYHSHAGVKRFDLAVKIAGNLQLLCYGVPSRKKLILKLHALERRPVKNPLNGKILDITLFAANAYARLLDSEELWLCNPVSQAHVRLYQSAGFEPKKNHHGDVDYLVMRLNK